MCAENTRNAFLSYQKADPAKFTAHILLNIFTICAPPLINYPVLYFSFRAKPQAAGERRLAEGALSLPLHRFSLTPLFSAKLQAGGGCRLAEGVPLWAKGKLRQDSAYASQKLLRYPSPNPFLGKGNVAFAPKAKHAGQMPLAAGRKFGCGAALHPHTPSSHSTPACWHLVVPTTLPCYPRVNKQDLEYTDQQRSAAISAMISSIPFLRSQHAAMISPILCPQIAFSPRFPQYHARDPQ